ncbi:MAG: transcriptional regulator [Paenibacillaceae bacterium]|jgi:DNA-binding MarR family transcriptional regulator|nr:transcriptional regulator [Paenibacillaceae bacterium]
MDNQQPDQQELFRLFTRLNWLLHRYHQHNHRHFGPMGDPHRGQGRILALLKIKPEISQKELSDILDMRSQSLGELLGKLEKNGYITRTPSEADRRVMEIRLTEAGKAASQEQDSHRQQWSPEAMFTALSEEEQANLGKYLSRIIATLEGIIGNNPEEEAFHGRGPMDGHGHGPWHGGGKHGRHHHPGGREFHEHSQRGWGPPFDGRGTGRDSGRRGEWPSSGETKSGAAQDADSTPDDPQDKP